MVEQARIIVVMGVTGVGKTTVGRALANTLGYAFVDADDFHSAENVEKMRRGEALDDDDRGPWLAALRTRLDRGDRLVLACSALKQAYREVLAPAVFVLLTAPPEVMAARLASRVGHFAGRALLRSQLEALDVRGRAPAASPIVTVDADRPVAAIIADIVSR